MCQFEDAFKHYQDAVSQALDHWLPSEATEPNQLHAAMRYSVMSYGKRIRPILVYATGEAFNQTIEVLNGPASAVEVIHAYSLIHDDLPSMDDDDLRRGRPTCHKAYDEATAILTGDALQALAFYILACDPSIKSNDLQRVQMIKTLAKASGSLGMAGGQAIDLASVGQSLTLDQLKNMHQRKTGMLIKASIELGALSAPNIEAQQFDHISHYADCIGLAFQIKDDILDVEGDTQTLGKPQGSDIAQNKPTYPDLLGLDGAKKSLEKLHQDALNHLDNFDHKADTLRAITDYIVTRNK